ncbi:MAG TPA: 3-methyl-2-oxobutanoate hydroxymethyltransferase [Kofleriaceae bacterium]|nr:3-methyl-2-oxobutanoate hydroxymethyltransferase [Kofleriaceae bacterium]
MSKQLSRVTLHTLAAQKARGEKIAMITAYDATFARLLDEAGADILLVGDSLGMVVQGHENTLPVTLEEIIYHCRAVGRGARRAQLVGDMPFMTYQESVEQGLRNAGRLVKEGGCHAVKLEGGAQHAPLVARLVATGIPVMGHLGLTPQSVHQLGGFKIQGKEEGAADRLIADARALEAAGAYAIVLEGLPTEVAAAVTAALTVPTIGIGAGDGCDGQVLVCYDLLGLDERFKPRFVRRYADLSGTIKDACERFIADVRSGAFPAAAESFSLAAKPEPVVPYASAGAR